MKVEVSLEVDVAADVLALIRSFETNFDHPFAVGLGRAVQPLRDVLPVEEFQAGDERYAAFARDVA